VFARARLALGADAGLNRQHRHPPDMQSKTRALRWRGGRGQLTFQEQFESARGLGRRKVSIMRVLPVSADRHVRAHGDPALSRPT